MNLSILKQSSKIKISDIAESEQTDKVKTELYDLIRQFVFKNQRHYYPHFKGDINDLVMDFYLDMTTKKSRVKGKEASLLDKWDPERLSLPALVKVSVIRKLIDRERTDKKEVNYAEKYDEETGQLSLDWLANKIEEKDPQLEDLEFTSDDILEMRDKYDEMPEDKKQEFLEFYHEVKNTLSPNIKEVLEDIVGSDKPKSHDTFKNKLEESLAGATVEERKVQGYPAIRIVFSDVDSAKSADRDNIDDIAKEYGYEYYTTRGSSVYYLKKE